MESILVYGLDLSLIELKPISTISQKLKDVMNNNFAIYRDYFVGVMISLVN